MHNFRNPYAPSAAQTQITATNIAQFLHNHPVCEGNGRFFHFIHAAIEALGKIHAAWKQELTWGDYRQLSLSTRQFAFARGSLIVAVNNGDAEAQLSVEANAPAYIGLLSGQRFESAGGRLNLSLPACGGEIYAPDNGERKVAAEAALILVKPIPHTVKKPEPPKAPAVNQPEPKPEDVAIPDIPYDLMTVEQLQAVILAKMAKNGPVTDRMRKDVTNNIWHNSLVNWANSFR